MMSQNVNQALAASVGTLPAVDETISFTAIATGTGAVSATLVAGRKYDIKTSADCFVCASPTASPTAKVTDYPLYNGETVIFTPDANNLFVSGITAADTALVTISPRIPVSVIAE